MKTRGAGAFSVTILIFLIAILLVAKAAGLGEWMMGMLTEVAQTFRIATGYNIYSLFSNVSMGAEFRTYAEVLASNWHLQLYFIGGGICALLSAVFVLRANATQLWRYHAIFVAFLILLLLPVALTTVTYGEILAARSGSYVCLVVLLLLGSFSFYELTRVKTNGAFSKMAQAVVLVLVLLQGVIVPLLYGAKFILSA